MGQPSLQTIRSRCKCPGCSLWLRLEAERSDLSYKVQPLAVEEVKNLVKTVKKIIYRDTPQSEARDLMIFNAGRYASGAKDQAAAKAAAELNKIIEGTTND